MELVNMGYFAGGYPIPDVPIFATGSRVYGTPTEESDYDYVIYVTPAREQQLKAMSDDPKTIRFGKVNLITCTSTLAFTLWAEGTRRLMDIAPIKDKSNAIAVFESLGLKSKKNGDGTYPLLIEEDTPNEQEITF